MVPVKHKPRRIALRGLLFCLGLSPPVSIFTVLRALTPLIWEHVNPYGRFELDMTTRLPLK